MWRATEIGADRRSVAAALVAFVLLASGCVTPLPTNISPFRIPPAEFSERVDTLCFTQFHSDAEFGDGDDDDRIANLSQAVADGLRARGYIVVDIDATSAAWKQGFDSTGLVFDPHTGRRDPERYALARGSGFEQLGAMGCDATLRSSLVYVVAPFGSFQAKWDGAKPSYGGGEIGYVGALSLRVHIEDFEGQLLYFGTGGVQVLANLKGLFNVKFETVEESALLADAVATAAAVDRALAGLGPSESGR